MASISGCLRALWKGSCKEIRQSVCFGGHEKSKQVYRELVEQADDIGDDNPMAYNELLALAFVAPYVASGKKIPPETVQEMMRQSLYHIKWYFAKTDLNTDKGKAENKRVSSDTQSGIRRKRRSSTRLPSRWTLMGSRMREHATTASPAALFVFIWKEWAFQS